MRDTDFDQLVQQAYDNLPEQFRAVCDDILLRTADFADQEVLDALEIENPYHLLGLYHGINLMNKSVFALPNQPDSVMIYRKPIIEYARIENLPIEDVITHVVVHEYGHHMGFSDEDMEDIEFGRNGFYHTP